VLAKHGGAAVQQFVSNPANNESKEPAPKEGRMNVLALTIFVTLALVCFFLFLFVVTIVEGKGSARDALLPLEDDKPEPAREGGVAK
jgi:hypothetical protein